MSFVRDLRGAAHSLRRTPGLAIAVILTLSLGIGANLSLLGAGLIVAVVGAPFAAAAAVRIALD